MNFQNLFFSLAFLVIAVYGATEKLYNPEAIIKIVNNAKTTWTAGNNFGKNTPLRFIKNLLGVHPTKNGQTISMKINSNIKDSDVPDTFDARQKWPYCPSIEHIKDQGNCGSCWAVSAASVFTDRLCIATEGKFKEYLSVEELLTCCRMCGGGCMGGDPETPWEYFQTNGLVTGGDYNSSEGCQPYEIEPCSHYVQGKRVKCRQDIWYETPTCQKKCTNTKYKTDFYDDHYKTKSTYGLNAALEAQKDIMTKGSVQAVFRVYTDFTTYKSGVYRYTYGDYLGSHGIRILGWGTENGTPYWLVANSWNEDWGNNGFFKIFRGKNECGIEEQIIAGDPDV